MTAGADRSKVGVIVAPRYFDTTSKELTTLVPEVDVLHTQLRVPPSFGYSLDEIVDAADEVAACAESLALAGADVVVQLGTPFSTAHGWDGGTTLRASIEERIGVPFEMMGISVPAAALALGVRRVTVPTTYYGPAWVERYTSFLRETGLEVAHEESFVDQGAYPTHEASWEASFRGFEPEQIVASIRTAVADHPETDGVLVPGLPCRLLDHVAALEAELGLPVVSYFSIWWRCLERLGRSPGPGHGRLLDLLG